ncbi:MAG: hypothetical protein ACYDEE_00165 [Ignavibacteriaceae bacterium]
MKIDNRSIRAAIIQKYGSLGECAKALGIKQNTLSANLKKVSPNLLERLKDVGVIIGTIENATGATQIAGVSGSVRVSNQEDIKSLKTKNDFELLKKQNEALTQQISLLKEIIKSKDETILALTKKK